MKGQKICSSAHLVFVLLSLLPLVLHLNHQVFQLLVLLPQCLGSILFISAESDTTSVLKFHHSSTAMTYYHSVLHHFLMSQTRWIQ